MLVAERIAATLRDAGIATDLQPSHHAGAAAGYDAIVFGSPVYDQCWLPDGDEFVRRNAAALAQRPVWLFSVGSFGDRTRIIGPLVRREPRNIRAVQDTVHPRDYRVFAGVIERRRWPAPAHLLYHAFGGRFGDNRDWDDIEAWARSIAKALRTPG